MMYEALLVPSESPATLRDIKRALLTYDKVVLIDPGDRGLIPNHSLFSAIVPLPIGIDMGPVRPMGKTVGYDEKFERTLDACAPAKRLIEVRSTYGMPEQKTPGQGASSITLGLGAGGYPIPTAHVLRMYRELAANQQFLRRALAHADIHALLAELSLNPDLAITNAEGDGQINASPALPTIELQEAVASDLLKQLTHIARARLGAFIKYTGYCEAKALVPVFPTQVYGGIAGQITASTREMLIQDSDPFWTKRNRVLSLAYGEYLQEDLLDDLSVEDVVRLRTSAWGQQGEAREQLFEAIFTIANEIEDAEKFDVEATKRIQEFYKQSADLIAERKKFNAGIAAAMGEGALLLAASSGVGTTINTLAQGILPAGSIWVSLVIGGAIWAMRKAGRQVPQLIDLRAREATMKRGAGMALHSFFSKIAK
jgi:hypothetical protein